MTFEVGALKKMNMSSIRKKCGRRRGADLLAEMKSGGSLNRKAPFAHKRGFFKKTSKKSRELYRFSQKRNSPLYPLYHKEGITRCGRGSSTSL